MDLLTEIYRLDPAYREGCSDLIFDQMDRMLCDGDFDGCDSVLRRADASRLSTCSLRAMLCITRQVKERLPSRPDFFRRAMGRFVEIRGPELAAKILRNLE